VLRSLDPNPVTQTVPEVTDVKACTLLPLIARPSRELLLDIAPDPVKQLLPVK
jgi:hypothetical protein